MSVLFCSLQDDASLFQLPCDVIGYIGKLFYQPVGNIDALILPQRVVSPFWSNLFRDYKDKFYFLSI